jgi:hypothetical protein
LQRTIGDEISVLKKQLPDLGGARTVSEALTTARAAESPDTALIAKLQVAAPMEAEIQQLLDERKSLSEKGPRDKHYGQGAMLAFIGTLFAIEVIAIACRKICIFHRFRAFNLFVHVLLCRDL